jgi:hypothetical protein
MKNIFILLGAAAVSATNPLTEAQIRAASLFYLIVIEETVKAVTVTSQTVCVDALRQALINRIPAVTSPILTFEGFCTTDKTKVELVAGMTTDAGAIIQAAYSSTTGGLNCLDAYLGAMADRALVVKAQVCKELSSNAPAVTAGLAVAAAVLVHLL